MTCRSPDRSTSPRSCRRRGTSGCRTALRSPSSLRRDGQKDQTFSNTAGIKEEELHTPYYQPHSLSVLIFDVFRPNSTIKQFFHEIKKQNTDVPLVQEQVDLIRTKTRKSDIRLIIWTANANVQFSFTKLFWSAFLSLIKNLVNLVK